MKQGSILSKNTIKIVMVIFSAAVVITLSACSDKSLVYTADEYDSIVSERNALTIALDENRIREDALNDAISERDSLILELDESRTREDGYKVELSAKDELIKEFNRIQAEEISADSDELSASAGKVETERKFLLDLDNLPWDLMRLGIEYEFIQTYINYSPEIRIRARTGYRNDFYMTIKVPLDDIGLSRQEIEFFISEDEYNELLKKQVGNTIYKTRYEFWVENHFIAVDVYSKDLSGLAVAEISFKSEEAANAYQPLDWFVKDVTSDKRYKNANLAKDGLPVDIIP